MEKEAYLKDISRGLTRRQPWDQLGSVAVQAALSGDNWLSTGSSASFSRQIVCSLSRDTNSLVIGTVDVDITNIRLFGKRHDPDRHR